MAKGEQYEARVEAWITPVLEQHQFELVDVEYVREVGVWYLRCYIDKEGGITVDDCEVISRLLGEWLDKEDIIKRVVSLEFNRMIDYYKDNDDIEVVDESAPRERGKRGGRGEAEEGYTRFFINFGKTDELTPPQLIELVNKCVPGKVRIGRIDLRDNFSFFEVEEGEANRVMDSMNGFEVDGRRISVEPAQSKIRHY